MPTAGKLRDLVVAGSNYALDSRAYESPAPAYSKREGDRNLEEEEPEEEEEEQGEEEGE